VTETGEIGIVACECEKRRSAALTNQHRHIPPLVFRSDQERAAGTEKLDVTAALAQEGKRVSDVAVERFSATDRCGGRQFGIGRVICNDEIAINSA
jgi:hypothetical protein